MSTGNLALASIVAFTLSWVGLPAYAQTTPAPAAKTEKTAQPAKTKEERQEARAKFEAQFKAADKNVDGGLSKDELAPTQKGDFSAIKKNFDAMDTNKDGKVTIAERDAWGKARAAEKKAVETKK